MQMPELTPNLMFFGALAGLAALTGVGVVALRDPVRSALSLVLNFFMLAGLYFSLNAEFLGIAQIVVYTGAIMVLFLFVIMLLNLGGQKQSIEPRDFKVPFSLLLGFGLFALIASQLFQPLMHITKVATPSDWGSPQNLGVTLFTEYVWPFELASVLLLLGLVGSIMLAKRRF